MAEEKAEIWEMGQFYSGTRKRKKKVWLAKTGKQEEKNDRGQGGKQHRESQFSSQASDRDSNFNRMGLRGNCLGRNESRDS